MNIYRFSLLMGISCVLLLSSGGIPQLIQESNLSEAWAFQERGNTLYVGGNGPGNYTYIQEAVDNASTGDTVIVYNGTYMENIIIDKTLILSGENENETIIDGNGMGDGVTISAENIIFSGFTIQNSGEQGIGAGITVLANNVTIQGCISQNNTYYGIYLMNCTGVNILNCTVFNNHFSGITLENSSGNNIVGCVSYGHQGITLSLPTLPSVGMGNGEQRKDPVLHVIYGYVYYGDVNLPAGNVNVTARDDNISVSHTDLTDFSGKYEITFSFFDGYSDGDHLTIWANGTGIFSGWKAITEDWIDENQTPVQYIDVILLQWTYGTGFFLINSTNNTLLGSTGYNNSIAIGNHNAWGNLFTQCHGYNNTQGIHHFLSPNNTVTECSFYGNKYGCVFAQNSTDNNVTANQIYGNDCGITISNSGGNVVYNNFFMNVINAIDDDINQWNISKTLGENIVNGTYLGGNFWDDYLGGDNDGDGLGDTYLPYNSSGKIQNVGDFHPLTFPNLKPTAEDDYYTIPEDSINITLDPLANDTDPENNTLTIATITTPLHGTATHNTTHITYTPTPNYYGTDTLTYTITDGNTTDTATIHITITNINDPPTANFTFTPENPSIEDVIQFTDTSTDIDGEEIITWLWNFGDGNTSSNQNPTHQYGIATIYQVTLTVWDTEGANDTITQNVSAIVPTIDYILITYKSHNEINDDNISTRFSLVLYASGFNTTLGYLGFVDANWSISTTTSNASLNQTTGATVSFDAGWQDGTATLSLDDGNGHSDTVEFTINSSLWSVVFYKSWNLITVPMDNTWTAESLGDNITGCSVVIMFNASTQTFVTHVVGIPHDDFPIEDGVGYFVFCTCDSIFSMPDFSISSVTVHIFGDWNILGWYQDYSTTAESLGQNISGTSVVIMFNSITQTFLTHVVDTPHDNFNIERGMGLFIYTTETSYWHGEG